MTTIVNFPTSRIVREVQPNIEEIEKVKEKGKQNYADSMAEEIAASLLIELENFGVDTTVKEFNKDFAFLHDVIKCIIYRNMDLKHGLQSFIDENVQIVEVGKEPTENDETIG
jgi:DNA-binding transcriptional regulator GbsR (MarR family)